MASSETAGTARATSPFWTFSLRLYGRPGVAPACLVLQDGSGVPVDVNIILFSLFSAREGRILGVEDARRIVDLVEPWRREVVVSLRTARRALKEPPAAFVSELTEALRQRVKAVELEAERLQQECLYASLSVGTLGTPTLPSDAAPRNIAAYEQAIGAHFDAAAVATLLDAFKALKD